MKRNTVIGALSIFILLVTFGCEESPLSPTLYQGKSWDYHLLTGIGVDLQFNFEDYIFYEASVKNHNGIEAYVYVARGIVEGNKIIGWETIFNTTLAAFKSAKNESANLEYGDIVGVYVVVGDKTHNEFYVIDKGSEIIDGD